MDKRLTKTLVDECVKQNSMLPIVTALGSDPDWLSGDTGAQIMEDSRTYKEPKKLYATKFGLTLVPVVAVAEDSCFSRGPLDYSSDNTRCAFYGTRCCYRIQTPSCTADITVQDSCLSSNRTTRLLTLHVIS